MPVRFVASPARVRYGEGMVPIGPIFCALYIALVGSMAWSALKHRREGWVSGLILAIMLATIPIWVMGGLYLYQALVPVDAK